jgi:PhzF family phenazine biosynthesis protein
MLNNIPFNKIIYMHSFVKEARNYNVIGNPVGIVFEKKFSDHERMQHIAIETKFPITAFVVPTERDSFNAKFYSPSGYSFDLCGHASIGIGHALKFFGGQFESININHQQGSNSIKIYSIETGFLYNLPCFKVSKIAPEIGAIIKKHFNLKTFLQGYFCFSQDLVVQLSNNFSLRSLSFQAGDFDFLYKYYPNLRGIMFFSESSDPYFSYEIRSFFPHLGIFEDIACGSGAASVFSVLKDYLRPSLKYSVLYPYKSKDNLFGGVMNVSLKKENLYIHGECSEIIIKDI